MFRVFLTILFSYLFFCPSYSQVTPQTGAAGFALPVFNWQDHKGRLKTSVALVYQSGNGLKVNELATSVGQGWNLVQGGVITRLQVGLPDDQKAFSTLNPESEKDMRKYPNGRLWQQQPNSLGYHPQVARYPLYPSQNEIYANFNGPSEDKQLDYFSFQFNGKSGTFVINPSEGSFAFTLEESGLKINFQHDLNLVNYGIRTTITSFTIQDEDGLIYKFSNKSVTKLLKQRFADKNLISSRTQPKFKNDRVYYQSLFDDGPNAAPWINSEMAHPFVVNAWHLSEIEDPLTGRKVIFNYETRQLNVLGPVQISNVRGAKIYAIVNRTRSISINQVVSGIQLPDGHVVSFNYGENRIDLPGDLALSNIDITYQGRTLSRHILRTAYMVGNRYASYRFLSSNTASIQRARRMARLCLRSVTKYGPDLKEDESPHQFDYYLGSQGDDIVPAPFSVLADNWGYYNGSNSIGFQNEFIDPGIRPIDLGYNQCVGLVFLRQGVSGTVMTNKSGLARNGLLRQIIYPGGGTMTYEYQQNRANLGGEREIGGVSVSKTSSTDGGGSNDCTNPIVTNYRYVAEDRVSSSMWGVETPLHLNTSSANYRPVVRIWRWGLNTGLFGQCDFRFKFPGLLSVDQGMGIDALTKVMNILTYGSGIYGIINTVSLVMKSIRAASMEVALIIDIVVSVVTLGISCILSPDKDFVNNVYVNYDLNQSSPLPHQYRRVEIIQGSGELGGVVQEFSHSGTPGVYLDPSPNANLTQKQRFSSWGVGLPTKTSVFDATGKLLSETINTYTIRAGIRGSCPPHSCLPNPRSSNIRVLWTKSQRADHWANEGRANNTQLYVVASNADMNIEYYGYVVGKSLLTRINQRTYRSDGANFIEEVSSFSYNAQNDLITSETVKSNGDRIYKNIRYNTNFNTGVLQTMSTRNILSVPVAIVTRMQIAGQMRVLDETVTEFVQTANGDIQPSRILKQRFTEPVASITEYQGPGSSITRYAVVSEYFYDGASNLTGLRDEGGRVVSNIYDYNDKFITASVVNANSLTDRVAHSSFENPGFGGWNHTGPVQYETSSQAKSGARLLTMFSNNGNTLSASGMNTSKSHTVSLWSSLPGVAPNVGSLVKSGPTLGGLTYYEFLVPSGNASVIVRKSGGGPNAMIDDLRLFPSNARMRTVTYDPLLGKTSETDENNLSSFYEYDNLGRMSVLRDEKKNILKVYEYNNVNPIYLTGCPKVYFNKYISEAFIKSNCNEGSIGNEIVFTIPANRYSSNISQEDADLKAEAELIREGQTYANSFGTCQIVYQNSARSQEFMTQTCNPGFTGGQVNYSVPAGRYSSTISQEAADEEATEEIEANGQAFANGAGAICIVSNLPQWEHLEIHADSIYCQSINGQLPPSLYVLETDVNPNSPSYFQRRWINVGPSYSCPSNTYFSSQRSQTFTRNNCGAGLTGTNWIYTVPPGKYSSTISQAAADQQAINDISVNGQAAANQFGSCSSEATVISNNSRSSSYSLRFQNSQTGKMFNFSAPPYQVMVLGEIPQGTYFLRICPENLLNGDNSYNIGTYSLTGVVCGDFYNIEVSNSTTVRIY